ncbi:Uncharacterized protein APZ42_012501 [Daphnia magna]|uniref:Uncharacterized protein n=1 Tax=Daphnia magna TaxID=35525 RepID=A0A0P6A7A7_9CRUS|nr:Uncharacterized protein APZ42_012501 [Daphnia magna]
MWTTEWCIFGTHIPRFYHFCSNELHLLSIPHDSFLLPLPFLFYFSIRPRNGIIPCPISPHFGEHDTFERLAIVVEFQVLHCCSR